MVLHLWVTFVFATCSYCGRNLTDGCSQESYYQYGDVGSWNGLAFITHKKKHYLKQSSPNCLCHMTYPQSQTPVLFLTAKKSWAPRERPISLSTLPSGTTRHYFYKLNQNDLGSIEIHYFSQISTNSNIRSSFSNNHSMKRPYMYVSVLQSSSWYNYVIQNKDTFKLHNCC